MGRAFLGSKGRSGLAHMHVLDVARKSHGAFGAWVQSVTVERFPGGAAVRGEGVGVVSEHNLLTVTRLHQGSVRSGHRLPQGVLSLWRD